MASKLNEHKRALSIVRQFFPKVKEVSDATEALDIEVTNKDSKSAAVRNHESCAMAVACKRKTKADGVIVSIGTAYVIKGEVAYRYRVPASIQREIVSFDREAGFAEGQYKLPPMIPSKRLGEPQPKGRNGTTGTPHEFHHVTSGIRAVLGSKES